MNEMSSTVGQNLTQPRSIEDKTLKPIYVWKTGRTMYLSRKEEIVAETYLKTRNYAECSRALKKEGFDKNWLTCKRWMERGHVQDWVNEQMEERGVYAGWSKERWFKVMTDHLSGKVRLKDGDGYFMNLLAKYKGWGTEGMQFNLNQAITVTQANGVA